MCQMCNLSSDQVCQEWLKWYILRPLTHETTHERFLRERIVYPTGKSCNAETLAKELSELSAVISDFPIVNGLSEDFQNVWYDHQLKDPTIKTGESIAGAIHEIRCSCECEDSDRMIRTAFNIASASWTEDQILTFHAQMKRGKGKKYGIYWPYDAARIGRVGRHELSLTAGLGLSGSDKLKVGLLTYRYVIWNWAHGRLGLTGGLQFNLAALFQSNPKGEYGALTGGLRFVSKHVSREGGFGGFIGRVETGFGLGEFSLKPVGPQGVESSRRSTDWILQVGVGMQFYIPRFTKLQPASLEAGFRFTQPIDSDARRIQTASLSFTLPF